MSEIWKAVVGYEGMYEVSNLGSVKSIERVTQRVQKGSVVKQPIKESLLTRRPHVDTGHLQVMLSKNGRRQNQYVHDLVTRAFLGPKPAGMQVCHGDGNSGNARLSNLRYDTPTGNASDRLLHGTDARGANNPGAKLDEAKVRRIRVLISEGLSTTEIGKQMNISRQTVNDIKMGRRWAHLI